MEKGSKAAIVCCSNGQQKIARNNIDLLKTTLQELGFVPVFSPYIYETYSVFSASGKKRAESLMDFYKDDEIKVIFDISGGDIANEILPYLDFELISQSNKKFWGYSDLTTVINAIYAKTGKSSVLYQIKNLVSNYSKTQISDFVNTVFYYKNDLYSFPYQFIQKKKMQGIVVGGNIRCLLKLAGTDYFPDMSQKILLLESRSGAVPKITTYLNQLKQMNVFNKINGIILGTFTEMEQKSCSPNVTELIKQYAGDNLPIAITNKIGHGSDSKAILIGKEITLCAMPKGVAQSLNQYYFSI